MEYLLQDLYKLPLEDKLSIIERLLLEIPNNVYEEKLLKVLLKKVSPQQ